MKSKKLFNRLNNCFVLNQWWRGSWTPPLLAEIRKILSCKRAERFISCDSNHCRMRRNLFIFSLLKTILPSGSSLQKATNSQCFPLHSGRQKCSSECCTLPWGMQWGDSGQNQPGPRSHWWVLRNNRDWTDREQSCCYPATELCWFSSAKPEDFLLSPALLSARPSPCQGCQTGSATQSQPAGTGTEQITWSSNQLPEIQGGQMGRDTNPCTCGGGCFHFPKPQHCGFWVWQWIWFVSVPSAPQQHKAGSAAQLLQSPGCCTHPRQGESWIATRWEATPGEQGQHQDSQIPTPTGTANAVTQLWVPW